MEASALRHASRRGLLARRSPVLKLEKDDHLVALIRSGHDRAFEVLFDRYHSRLLAFCTSMLKSRQDAEDVLQDVFVNAHKAMLADDRKINVRPWLYRIARNRCLNHLRRPVPEGQDSMDIHPHQNGTTTAERVQKREELRQVLSDVETLPETQRTALLLREIDQLSYDDIAVAMDTTIPAVKSLLVRARITLAESSQARALSCDEVRVTLAEAAEGLRKADGPVRIHLKSCEGCADFRKQLRSDRKALAALFPLGPLAMLKAGFLAKLFGGGSAGGAAGTGAGAGAAGTSSALGAIGGTAAGSTAAGGLSAIGGAIGTKAAAGVATAALLTAGAVEVGHVTSSEPAPAPAIEIAAPAPEPPRVPAAKNFQKRVVPVAVAAAGAAGQGGAERAAAAEGAGSEAADTSPPAGAADVASEAPPATEEPGDEPVAVIDDETAGASGSTPGRPADEGGVVGGEIGDGGTATPPGDGTTPTPAPVEPGQPEEATPPAGGVGGGEREAAGVETTNPS